MKVVLKKDVAGTGQAGQVREVADGYFRNYLSPRGLAVPATEANIAEAEKQIRETQAQAAGKVQTVKVLAEKMNSQKVVFEEKAKDGKLFGSVDAKKIAEKLNELAADKNIKIEEKMIQLKEPIRKVEDVLVKVELRPEVSFEVKVSVKEI